MTGNDQVIAVCSVGSLGKYLCDELLADGRYKFVVINRQVGGNATAPKKSLVHPAYADLRVSSHHTRDPSSTIAI